MKDFFRNLQFIFRPNFWLMNDPYDKDWDNEFNMLLDEHTFSNIGEHTAKLGDTTIWISNYPFACFRKRNINKRPSRLTILRAKKQLKLDILRKKHEIQYNIIIDRYTPVEVTQPLLPPITRVTRVNYSTYRFNTLNGKLKPRGRILKHRFPRYTRY